MSRREKVWWLVGGLAIVVYALFPVAWIVSLSRKAPADIDNGQFLPRVFSWGNYALILTGDASELFLPALRNSFGICLIATAISSVLSMFAAYAIARLDSHLSVYENIAFPLRLKKAPEDEVRRRVTEAADVLELHEHLQRKPANLSGGQRQRVAMRRATESACCARGWCSRWPRRGSSTSSR